MVATTGNEHMRRSSFAVLGLTASACISPTVVLVQPAGPDALTCVRAELRRLGYTYSPQTPSRDEIHAWRPGGDQLRARVHPDRAGLPTLRLEAFRYNDFGAAAATGWLMVVTSLLLASFYLRKLYREMFARAD